MIFETNPNILHLCIFQYVFKIQGLLEQKHNTVITLKKLTVPYLTKTSQNFKNLQVSGIFLFEIDDLYF